MLVGSDLTVFVCLFKLLLPFSVPPSDFCKCELELLVKLVFIRNIVKLCKLVNSIWLWTSL
jgi:hypothetical protein